MKANVYRLTLLSLLFLSLGFDAYCLYLFIQSNPSYAPKSMSIIATCVLVAVIVFEIYCLIRGLTKEKVLIHDLVYEKEQINKLPMIVNNIILGIAIVLQITFGILLVVQKNFFYIYLFLLEIGLPILINTIYYDLYLLVAWGERRDEYKLIGRRK